jgi:hypothetical protein
LQTALQYRPTTTTAATNAAATTATDTAATDTATAESSRSPVRKIVFLSESLVAAVTAQALVVWDLTRGVVAYAVSAKKEQLFVDCVGSSTATGTAAVCSVLVQVSDKVQIHQYATQATLGSGNGKLLRKIKVAKHATAAALACTKDYLVVRCADAVRVLDLKNGQKVTKCAGLVPPLSQHACLAVTESIAVTVSGNQVVAVHLATGTLTSSSSKSNLPVLHNPAAGVQLHVSNGETVLMVDGTKLVKLVVSAAAANDAAKSDAGHHEYTVVAPPVAKWTVASDLNACTVVGHSQTSNHLTAVLYQAGKFQVQSLPLPPLAATADQQESNTIIAWSVPSNSSTSTSTSTPAADSSDSAKRKLAAAETNSLTVLGPAQAGGEARSLTEGPPATKKSRGNATATGDDDNGNDMDIADNDDEGATIAERLERLQQALDEEDDDDDDDDDDDEETVKALQKKAARPDFIPKKATTESLTQLLEQALQSADDSMLELALEVRDPAVLRETCRELAAEYLQLLLTALTVRLAGKPARAEQLCAWLTAVLVSGKIRAVENVQPLRNLIQERLEVFPALMKLDGRLSMMSSL